MRTGSVCVVVLAMACGDPLAGRQARLPVIEVETVANLDVDAVMPSDALLLDDGSVLVLDGYGGRVSS